MRRITYGLLVFGMGLGVALLARERRGLYEGESAGRASRQLMAEHEVILEVLRAAQAKTDHVRQGFNLDENRVREIVDFSRNFTDRCHHGKEERFYFPAAEVYTGRRLHDFLEELTVEHAYGRSIMDEIDYLLGSDDTDAARLIAERLSVYISTMRRHIEREDGQLYRKSGIFLPGTEERALMIGFDRLENVDLGVGFHERYHRLAEGLSEGLLRR
jgi:hemerythrin-like domain-containing protein